jgi:deazaflavin-dependent oxidoreductase (nitroreductase family)
MGAVNAGDALMSTTTSHGIATREIGGLPSWLKGINRVIIALQHLGFVVGSMHVLTVPGRQSGVLRSTPVSLLSVDDRRYIVAGLDNADWVLNARAAGRGILCRGRTEEQVSLVELPVDDRAPILREFPRLVPQGVQFFTRLYGVTADPEAFAALAARCPVFRVERR